MTPEFSIVIPVYNRGTLIRHTLESVQRAAEGLSVETIIVDDGSDRPVSEDLRELGFSPSHVIRQENHGLLFARLAGLARATGRWVLFLDSDDLIGPQKLAAHRAAIAESVVDITFSDTADVALDLTSGPGETRNVQLAGEAKSAADLLIRIQPAPHCPIFRADYLRPIVDRPIFPPSKLYNPVAEIWFYYNAAPQPARVRYIPGLHTLCGRHASIRLSNHWERLGIASLAVLEAFARTAPRGTATADEARQLACEASFRAWRALPKGVPAAFADRLLAASRRLGEPRAHQVGSDSFRALASIVGPLVAARLIQLRRRTAYADVRTLSAEEFAGQLGALPSP
jgi:hypothetical protein